jgi:hypothetical protein
MFIAGRSLVTAVPADFISPSANALLINATVSCGFRFSSAIIFPSSSLFASSTNFFHWPSTSGSASESLLIELPERRAQEILNEFEHNYEKMANSL